jgi:hypothetical protein
MTIISIELNIIVTLIYIQNNYRKKSNNRNIFSFLNHRGSTFIFKGQNTSNQIHFARDSVFI